MAMAGNLAPAKPESNVQKIGNEEQSLQVAVQGQRILNSSIEEIKQVLRYVMIKIGLRASNWPGEEETAVLIQHIVFNFSSHTIDEIKLAFDMALTGKLNADPNCFENFSCLYLSGIMNAYRIWAAEAYRQTVKAVPEQKIYTDKELWSMQREDMENAYQRMKAGKQNNIPVRMKEVLIKDGLITEETDLAKWLVEQIGNDVKHLYVKK